jgi:FG-GAP repeat
MFNRHVTIGLYSVIGFIIAFMYPVYALAIPKTLSPDEIFEIQKAAGKDYAIESSQADNPAQGWKIRFEANTVEITPKSNRATPVLQLGLSRVGSSQQLHNLPVIHRKMSGNLASYLRGPVEEWYVNGPLGLEQGFVVARPFGRDLVVELNSSWAVKNQGNTIQLSDGERQWQLGALQAVDATGRKLPSAMKAEMGKIRLEVATSNARFPVTIDPILSGSAPLTPTDQAPFLGFGRSVAMSGDGKTVVVGTDKNAAYIYTRSASGWVQTQKLDKPGKLNCNGNGSYFGWTAALSNDGKTIMVSASGILRLFSGIIPINYRYSCKELPVYAKKGKKWVLEKLITAPSVSNDALFGSSIAIAKNGKSAIVGAEGTLCADNVNQCGAVYLFERKGKRWKNQKAIVNNETYAPTRGYFGATTAISANGQWALVGVPAGDSAWLLKKLPPKRGGWTIAQALKSPIGRLTKDFGSAVAVSANGDRALISAESATNDIDCNGDFRDCGAVYSFVRQGELLALESSFTAVDSSSFNSFGESLAMSANGDRAVIGASGANCDFGNCGGVYLFNRSGSTWVQDSRTTGPIAGIVGPFGGNNGGRFGENAALSSDGKKLLVGAREDDCALGEDCGFAYAYDLSP